MKIRKQEYGSSNIVGKNIEKIRKEKGIKQKDERLQQLDLELKKLQKAHKSSDGESANLKGKKAKDFSDKKVLYVTSEQFIDDFKIGSVKIKSSNIPEKIKCIESFGFIPSKTYRTELGYHEYNI